LLRRYSGGGQRDFSFSKVVFRDLFQRNTVGALGGGGRQGHEWQSVGAGNIPDQDEKKPPGLQAAFWENKA
jgi:hypothetical protein